MPNWCTGNIRFRGKIDNILNLLKNSFIYCVYGEEYKTIQKPAIVEFDGEEITVSSPFDDGRGWLYIDDTHRNFIDLLGGSCITTSYVHEPTSNDDDQYVVLFDSFQAAWSIEPDPYVEMSKKYDVDIKIFGWESGMEFDQEIEIVNGKLIKNEVGEYHDPGDWAWNSILPYMGG